MAKVLRSMYMGEAGYDCHEAVFILHDNFLAALIYSLYRELISLPKYSASLIHTHLANSSWTAYSRAK